MTREATVVREVFLDSPGELKLNFGYSDQLVLEIDGEEIFNGENTFESSPVWEDRGYVSIDEEIVHNLTAGKHRITARLKAIEPFGFGLALILEGEGFSLVPPQISF